MDDDDAMLAHYIAVYNSQQPNIDNNVKQQETFDEQAPLPP